MKSFLAQVVFTAAGISYDWADVLLSARAWGEWSRLEDEVRQGIACVKYARATRKYPGRVAVETAAKEFRLARDLRAAVVMNAWLERRGLSADDWMNYIRRALLRHQWADKLVEITAGFPVSRRDVSRNLRLVGICSGHLVRFARELAARVAVQPRSMPSGEAVVSRPLRLPGLSAAACRPKLEALARLEASFQSYRRGVLTPDALQRQLEFHCTDWIRFEGCSASFADAGMAREAALCVRVDGEQLAEVAPRASSVLRPVRVYHEQLEPPLRPVFLSARAGDLLGPFPVKEEFHLVLVQAKVLPALDDPEMHRRAEQEVLQKFVSFEIDQHIHWTQGWHVDEAATTGEREPPDLFNASMI